MRKIESVDVLGRDLLGFVMILNLILAITVTPSAYILYGSTASTVTAFVFSVIILTQLLIVPFATDTGHTFGPV
jgi:hypothetical protein